MAPARAVWEGILFCVVILLCCRISEGAGAAPTFTNTGTRATVAENTPATTSFFRLLASDPEGDALTFTMTTAGSPFTLVGQDLQVSGALDYETTNYYLLAFTVSDGTTTVAGSYNVDITDVNDNTPIITAITMSVNIDEEQAAGTVVPLNFTAADDDALDTGKLEFTLSGAHATYFSMEITDGTVKIAQRLDREATPPILVYNLTLTVTDTAGQTDTADLTVTLDDINDNTPSCSESTYYATLVENSAVNTSVQLLTCNDADSSPNGDITVTINSGDDSPPKFQVNGQTIVTTATVADYEATKSYTLEIHVVDGGATQKTGTTSVVVTISPENEFTPIWGAFTPTSVLENANVGTYVVTIAATDSDDGTDGAITYSLVTTLDSGGLPVSGIFNVDSASGNLTTSTTLDRETMASYSVTVRASDGGTPTPKTVDNTFTITINDYNDNAPVFTGTPYSKTLLESSTVGTSVIDVAATDADASSTLTYAIETGDTSKFNFSSNRIELISAISLPTDPNYYILRIIAKDGGTPELTGTTSVTVSITDVNANTPSISTSGLTTNIDEELAVGTVVNFNFTATDSDNGDTLTYTLTGLHAGYFHMDSRTGQVTIKQRLDREAATPILVYDQLTLTVTDTAGQADTAALSVTLDDINDNTPSCTPSVYYPTLNENTATDNAVQVLTCTDADSSPNGDITVTINSGDATGHFKVTGQTILTTATATDYETVQSHTLEVHVVDGGATKNTATVQVVVKILPLNEATPVWGTFTPASPYSVGENVQEGTLVVTIAATDADDGTDGRIEYSLVSTTDSGGGTVTGIFYVNPTSGALTTSTSLDRETTASYSVTVRASDGGTPTPNTVDNTFTITINDYNDNTPVFTGAPYSNTLAETATTTANTTIVSVAATDGDASSTLTYAIEDGDTARFQFGPSGLELKTAINLDKPANDPNYYLLRIIVKDGGTPELTGTTSVTVSILAVNDHDPVMGAGFPSSVSFAENTVQGTQIETVVATDQDVGTDGQIIFSLTGGNTNDAFAIGRTSGEITLAKPLDYDTTSSYTLEVTASDEGSPVRSVTTVVTVTVTNINDNSPVCTPFVIYKTVLESSAVNDLVTTLSCTDADGDNLTYTITSGNGGAEFYVNSTTGAITLLKTLDYDSATTSYTLKVDVNDGTNARTVTVEVDVGAVNEHRPTFTANQTTSIAEDDSPGKVVYTYTAVDADFDPHDITQYAITGVTQGGNGNFNIDPSTGVITLLSPVDYDTLPDATKFYLISVSATDGGGLAGTGTVTVSVTDVNDNAPSCSPSSVTLPVAENTATSSTVIASLGCTDVENDMSLTYAISQTPGAHFGVTAGAVTLDTTIDYEANTAHTLTLTVTDAGTPSKSTTVIVNINVGNINDGPPSFTGTFAKTIAENITPGTSVIDVVATDPDGTNELGSPVYSIISGDPGYQFIIDSKTGQISTRSALDREATASYNLVVRAKESGGTGTAAVNVTITVSDVNDNPPSCTQNNFVVDVSESEVPPFVVNAFTCTDADATGTLTYTLTTGNAAKFETNAANLRLKDQLDFESGVTKYDVTVTVSDSVNNVVIPGTINVLSVNEAPPVFSPVTYSPSRSESLALTSTIVKVSATDADSASTSDGQIVYAFVASYPQFSLDSSSGLITLASALDWETNPNHVLLVTATDGTTIVTATVSLTVTDENEHAPVLGSPTYSGTVSEGDAVGASVVVTVAATDEDDSATNGNGAVTYSIIAGDTNSDFTINANNGELRTAKQLNYETAESYLLTVKAVDRGGDAQSKSSTSAVSVTVTHVNEFNPVFSLTTVTKSVPETTAVGTLIHQAVATDADNGVDGDITYTMPASSIFSLSVDGALTLKATAVGPSYTLTITATDGGTPARSASQTVMINISDVNTEIPSCSPSSVVVTMREDATGNVATLACTDTDSGASGTLTYTFVSVGSSPFALNAGTGVVSIGTNLDFEAATAHTILIRVADGAVPALSTTVTVNVDVSDVNEAAPVFSATPFNLNMAESKAVGDVLFTAAATDADTAETIAYYLSDTTNFLIDSTSGIVTVKVKQDREATTSLSFSVCANDSGVVDAVKTTCEPVAVTITDVNDNSPVFNPGVYSANVSENTAASTTVITVTATDADAAAFGTITYSIAGGNTDSVFTIDGSAGHIIVASPNTFLDYERTQSFTLTVRASDGGTPTANSADAIVTVTVNPVNEGTPTFTPASSTQTVPENTPAGTAVINLNATDTDSGTDGQITYSILSGADGKFNIDPLTGIVTVSSILDTETVSSYTITVQATDGGDVPSALVGTYTLTVTVTDSNDNTPLCTFSTYVASISESATAATSVQQLGCSDGDTSSPNNVLTYTETGGDANNLFEVNPTTGLVSVSAGAAFDRETTASYLLNITVADGGTPTLSLDIQVSISLTDVNDVTPAFTSDPYNSTAVAENAAPGTVVATISAVDNDAGSNGEVVYSITAGNALGHFTLNSATGVLSVQSSLDRENLASYVLAVQAQDKGNPTALSSTSTVSISLQDVNDNAPIFTQSVYTATTAEDTGTGTSLTTVSATDADIAPNNNIQYTITAGNTGNVFAVNINTGVVSVALALNAESKKMYALTVQASDGTLTTDAAVTITVTDVNEFDPAFNPTGPYSAPYAENTSLGTTIIDINAVDNDISNSVLSYTIVSGNTGNAFWINQLTGEVVLQAALDRETTNSYSLSVEVADGTGAGSRTATTILTVPVQDINDNDPVCSPPVYIKTQPEDSIIGTTVTSLVCSDVDTSTPTLAYKIISGNTGTVFFIDAASGVITLLKLLDYETTTSYSLVVEISDQGTPPRNVTVPVTVEVGPVNEHPPVFTPVTLVTLLENVGIGTDVYQMNATDADRGLLHGTVKYFITNGNTLGQFSINQGSGQIKTVGSLDRENIASYTLTVRAMDDSSGSGNEKSADINLIINIGDINDNIPTFTPVFYSSDVLESAPTGSTLVLVTSRDNDDGLNAATNYSIISGNTGNVFTFVGNELQLDKPLDYETQTQYSLDVQVSDSGTPALTSSGKIIVTVLSVNEFAPIPGVPNDSINMSELTPVGTNFYNASATDSDGGTDGVFTWSILNVNVPFFCNQQLGELFTSSFLDYDTPPNTYNLTVQAQDNGGLTGSFWLGIQLQDENDEYPVFTETMYKPLLNENVAIGTSVVTVNATDKDSGINGQVVYSILSGDTNFFTIDSTSGIITTLKDIDYETHKIFFLVLRAVDSGTPSLSTIGSVRVTVVDMNDNPPVFTPDTISQRISEDVTVGTKVTTVYASDADSVANGNNVFTYSLTDPYFEINPSSGQISTKEKLDRETIGSHNLTIHAVDQGTPPLNGTIVVSVSLDDVNDNDPVVTGNYSTNLSEDIAIDQIVFTIAASDIDVGVNAELEYTIVSGNSGNDFKIEIGSGIVQVQNTLDRERTPAYNLVIHVMDKGTPRRTASVTTTVVIDDINDNNPIFVTSPYIFNIAENVPIGSTVGVIQATDQDALTNAALTYEIVVFWTGTSTHFMLNTSTGQITTTGSLDRELINLYALRCRAKDGGTPQLSGDVNVTITIDDLNDNPPVFNPTLYTGMVTENSVAGTSILTVTVTDADPQNGAITLSIDTSTTEGTRGDTFLTVDSATGIISVKAVIDREVDSSFSVIIKAVDNGTVPFTSSASVYITVNDVNDNVPVFSQTFYNTEIAYTATCDNTILTLTATDADSGTNGEVTYYFSSNPYGFFFVVGGSSGEVTLQTPVKVNTKYVLEASAKDNGSPSRSSNSVVAFRVDTFDPNQVVITIKLGISKADFLLRESQFLSQLKQVLASKYPSCLVKVWCLMERAGTAVPAPTRRRLLQTTASPVDVNIIVLSDNATESQSNLAESKTFVTSGEITGLVTSDVSGTPSSVLTGAAWDYYQIQKVVPYFETVTPWYQTAVGIVFITLACVLALALVILTIIVLCICRKKRRPVTPIRQLVEEKRPNQKTVFVSRATVPDLDLKDAKKHPPPAVVALPMPANASKPVRYESLWDEPEKMPRVETADRPNSSNDRLTSPRTPRSVLVASKNENDGYFIRNRHFDGTAVDPGTGKVYEYNTKTNERKWLSTPDGKAVVATDSLVSDV